MVDETSLKRFVADLVRLTGYPDTLVEGDVWQKLAMNCLYSNSEARANLIFKGGTCITRTLLGYYRFSEDLDFAWLTKKGREYYETFTSSHLKPLSSVGISLGEHYGTQGGRLMKWDLVCGRGKLVLSVNFAQEITFPTEVRPVCTLEVVESEKRKLLALHPLVAPDYFRELKVPCYSAKEIACEKLVAILTRKDLTKPRDMVDLFHMQERVDLPKLVSNSTALGKMKRQVHSTSSYARVFKERKNDVSGYLKRLAEEAENERALYVKPTERKGLEAFSARVLAPALQKLVDEIERQ
ncbi:MAG: nucleotidyl transferase AbiEii/AbiGii toxin family protein [Candidatus Marsarchaeota archaeon]|nr:nucleotidyl transferase AbiEii/AbiGii toxin family protein [Candidatus Marsarchaeota archaeon]